jgi:hypothetical protein
VELDLATQQHVKRGTAGGALGLTSAALLFASFRWALFAAGIDKTGACGAG